MIKAIFLDRDGVLNVFKLGTYVNKPEDLEVFPFAGPAISIFNDLGYTVFVITNQSGIAKGHFGLATLCDIHRKLTATIQESGGDIKRFYTCIHNPGDKMCKCRKPKPGMILEAAATYDIDLSKSYMVGDAGSDIEAGVNAGCRTVAVLSGQLSEEHEWLSLPVRPEFMFTDVYRFAINLKNEEISNGMGHARAEEEWPPTL
jgi:D-glycero-D-manno-heptose 1,7-bisphosphate phosphatase